MSKFIIPVIVFILAGFMIYRTWMNHKSGEENIEQGQQFLVENGAKEGVVTTESGLQYLVLEEGTGTEHPTKNSKVTVHYHGTLIDGTVFDSSVERGEPISFSLKQVIKGWQEGLTYMVEGQKVRLFIPSQLGYGKGGSGPIPPSSTLIFDVELISIK
ncbi:FKBP-type peptidyl-prolyl cis-trans isomerase [Vibrio splendidus]|uniref:FKBP-type peptidyl-prolyl cis-trans isomerase n=1 Tax=Vibrio splendidus TaxID=29497 RepID=UPI00246887B2|nr:FKBP-type peptidyl-prolyl cis-trans isomerase [Vibrio splendidus]MDH5910549.1 FKBP-type peptidyl-prolyl cis-trans isomerase [Vibrio splendidus]MDH5943774.1 FKBP-type peptidyl-prolyl cis-trans isomerase [Vibrio splendidus]MDH5983407.1 FKBP-type peptidyl-prolyl cis-trans isomerase [Vibrio splendidus]MDH5995547.1 FKBP-type peptidyl-prolyl cis-trans isomerase [Vibrio splendidus]MDH6004008.1 FKBP-type peptidyl-prolyl cis-trans isomerase [Vibrio splendidus]